MDILLRVQHGDADAHYSLASMYEYGICSFRVNIRKAIKHYTLSANKDYVPAMYKLAYLYENGKTGTVDAEKALAFYRKGSDMGCKFCSASLARIFEYGDMCVSINYTESYKMMLRDQIVMGPRLVTWLKRLISENSQELMLCDSPIRKMLDKWVDGDTRQYITAYIRKKLFQTSKLYVLIIMWHRRTVISNFMRCM